MTMIISASRFAALLALVFEATPSHGFAASKFPFGSILDEISKSNPFAPPAPQDDEKDGAAVLKALNMTSGLEPKTFYARPQDLPALFTASIPAVFRFGSGVFADGYGVSITERDDSKYTIAAIDKYQISETSFAQQNLNRRLQREPIVIYEFEACPFCRKVREAVSMLSLSVTFCPCPKDGARYRRDIKEQYGRRATFPFLRDPNTGIEMFESDAIVEYLFKTYGSGKVPWTLSTPGVTALTAGLGLLARAGKGGTAKPSNPPPTNQPVIFWAYEGSPFCKLVREELCALEIPHTQISCPRGSPNRQTLKQETGRFQVPYLYDENTGVSLFESQAIIEYIQKQYGVTPTPVKYI